jgi:hypothetical protein
MEGAAWTDERLGDMSRRMDEGFARIDADLRELRAEIRSLRDDVRGEIGGLRGELHGEIEAFRVTVLRVGGGMMVGLVGVIAAVLVRGV